MSRPYGDRSDGLGQRHADAHGWARYFDTVTFLKGPARYDRHSMPTNRQQNELTIRTRDDPTELQTRGTFVGILLQVGAGRRIYRVSTDERLPTWNQFG